MSVTATSWRWVWLALLAVSTVLPAWADPPEETAPALRQPPLVVDTLADVASIEVDRFYGAFGLEFQGFRPELIEYLHAAVVANPALPQASPADGLLTLSCSDSWQCFILTARLKTAPNGKVLWQRRFSGVSLTSRFPFFVFPGVTHPQVLATTITTALAKDYEAATALPTITNTD